MQFTFYYINLIFLVILMLPSVFFQAKKEEEDKERGYEKPQYHNKSIEMLEKIGRYGTLFFYVIRLESDKSSTFLSYLIPGLFLAIYLITWYILREKPGMLRAVLISVIPSLMFISSAAIDRNYLLLIFSLIFAPAHIAMSIKSAAFDEKHRS